LNILDSMSSPTSQQTAAPAPGHRAEAARYALLRRLAPSMRHHLVVNLQPIGMIYEVTERRLRASEPDMAGIQESVQRINGFTRAALAACSDVVSWLAPVEDACVPVDEGVRECAGMLATSLSFRGYSFDNQVGVFPGQVRLPAVRCVLTAAMLHITDHGTAPATVVLTSTGSPRGVDLLLRLGPSDEQHPSFSAEPDYRRMDWPDLQALGAAEGAEVAREEGGAAIRMSLAWSEPAPAA
jgi:hypothetical protein